MRTRGVSLLVALSFALVPTLALATADNISIDFVSPGGPHDLYVRIVSLAWNLLPLALLAAFFLEFIKPPGESRNYAAVALRGFLIVAILWQYPALAGTVVKSMDGLAQRVSPDQNALSAFAAKRADIEAAAMNDPKGTLSRPAGGANGDTRPYPTQAHPSASGDFTCPGGMVKKMGQRNELVDSPGAYGGKGVTHTIFYYCINEAVSDTSILGNITGGLFEMVLSLLFAILGAARFVVEAVGGVLTAVYYVLGPLALTAAVPRISGTGGSWFKHFLVYASWPVFTGLLMNLVVHVSADAVAVHTGYGNALWTALAIAISMLSAPVLATQLIGAGGGHFMSGVVGAASGYAAGAKGAASKAAMAVATGGTSSAVGAVAKTAQLASAAAAAPRSGGGRESGGGAIPNSPG